MRILWLTNIPSPYRVDFFNELGKKCELTVLFEKRASDERNDSWKKFDVENFNAVFLSGKSVRTDSAFCVDVLKYIKKNTYDHIVVSNFYDVTGIMAISALYFKKIPYMVESDGGFVGSGKGLKEKFKKWLLKNATLYFSTAEEHDKYYLTYGAKKEEIVRYPFTSLKNADVLPTPISAEKKQQFREKLGMKEKKAVLTIGQFIHRKGFDVLMKAAVGLDKNVGIYIVGGNPTEEYLQMQKDLSLDNVHFVGFKVKKDLTKYYEASDAFVLPTREDIWGLVINEAMAKGLPVVTTDRCIAGLELIKNGENGYVVSTADSDALCEKLNIILGDSDLCERMSRKSIEIISEYTIEKMAERHIEVFGGVSYK